jgi:quercetin dioxygenase-like cupin family protein
MPPEGETMSRRRVVTGHNAAGNAVVVSDAIVDPIHHSFDPEFTIHWLWGGDAAPRFPDAGEQPPRTTYFPPLGGYRFTIVTMPPPGRQPAPVDLEEATRELEARLPGVATHLEADEPGMHTTATVDLELVLSGVVGLELDDGQEVVLRAGDTIVQNGTRHRWHNRGDTPVVMLVVAIGARHDNVVAR